MLSTSPKDQKFSFEFWDNLSPLKELLFPFGPCHK